MVDIILLCLGLIIGSIGLFFYLKLSKKLKSDQNINKKEKKKQKLLLILCVISGYLIISEIIKLIFGKKESEGFNVSIWAERVQVGNLNLSTTIIYTWIIMAVLIIIALILRFTVIRHFKDEPTGLQNVLEICVESVSNYTNSNVKGIGDNLSSYLFALVLFMIGCAITELFGVRSPTSDITLTFAMALITFVLINYYGIKKKGVFGRIKSLAKPTPIVFPIKIISDCAIPVSLACRLFGNMLGGMIVMDLLYMSLSNYAIGIPSVLGLYFNVFHPLIQAFIFVTLSLTFINEAVE